MATLEDVLNHFTTDEYAELKQTIGLLAAGDMVTARQALLYARWGELGGPEALRRSVTAIKEAHGTSDRILDQLDDEQLDLLYDALAAIRDEGVMTEAQEAIYKRWQQIQALDKLPIAPTLSA